MSKRILASYFAFSATDSKIRVIVFLFIFRPRKEDPPRVQRIQSHLPPKCGTNPSIAPPHAPTHIKGRKNFNSWVSDKITCRNVFSISSSHPRFYSMKHRWRCPIAFSVGELGKSALDSPGIGPTPQGLSISVVYHYHFHRLRNEHKSGIKFPLSKIRTRLGCRPQINRLGGRVQWLH